MRMHLNCESSDVDDLKFEKDTDFAFHVVFDDGRQFLAEFEAGEGLIDVYCTVADEDGALLNGYHLGPDPAA